jgi:hypothetical protein
VIPSIPEPAQKRGRGRPRLTESVTRVSSSNDTPPKKSGTNTASNLNADQISALLQGVFSVVALKAGDHWNINKEESSAISEPLCRILERYNLAEKVAEMSDGAALVLALLTIVGGRIMLSMQKKTHNDILREEAKTNGQPMQPNTEAGSLHGTAAEHGQADKVSNNKGDSHGNFRVINGSNTGDLQTDTTYIKTLANGAIGSY